MESIGLLFNLIFSMLKLVILGSVHATTSLIFFRMIGGHYPYSWFARVTKDKMKYWFVSASIISVFIFFFSFTYWGDNGVFATARIPLGYGKEVSQSADGLGDELSGCPESLGDFTIEGNYVCGFKATYEGDQFQTTSDEYLVWNLETDTTMVFKSKKEYVSYARKHHLPTEEQFETFHENYWNHWFGLIFFFII